MEDENKIKALISLLDDEDGEVSNLVFNELVGMGKNVLPFLENAWQTSYEEKLNGCLEEVISRIHFEDLKHNFSLQLNDQFDLIKLMIIINHLNYPDLDNSYINSTLAKVRREVWLELGPNLTPPEQINVFNQVVFSHLNYKVAKPQGLEEKHLYLNKMLETKTACDVLLCAMYMHIARQLDLAVYAVKIPPGTFALCFCRRFIDVKDSVDVVERQILFYINPATGGGLFTRKDIDDYLKGIEEASTDFSKCHIPISDELLLMAYLDLMLKFYETEKNDIKTEQLNELKQLLD